MSQNPDDRKSPADQIKWICWLGLFILGFGLYLRFSSVDLTRPEGADNLLPVTGSSWANKVSAVNDVAMVMMLFGSGAILISMQLSARPSSGRDPLRE